MKKSHCELFFLAFILILLNRSIEDPSSLSHQNLRTSMEWNLMGELIYINNSDPLYSWSITAAENDWCSGSELIRIS